MASGLLGKADLAAATATLLYTVPSGVIASLNVRFANRNGKTAQVRLAIGTGASPAVGDYLSYNQEIPAGGIIEDTGVVCSSGEKIWAYSTLANVSVRVHGYEEVV